MKNLLLILFFGVLLFNCKRSETKKTDIPEMPRDSAVANVNKEPQRTDEELQKEREEYLKDREEIVEKFVKIREGNGFTYRLFCEQQRDSTISFKSIQILKGRKIVQNIKVDTLYVYNKAQIYFEINDDVNFDEENDIQLVNWVGMHATDITFSFYIYDKNISKYKHDSSLDDITNLEINKKNKTIVSQYFIGPVNQNEEIYKWKKGKLFLISGYNTNPYTNEIEKFHVKNGKRIDE